jgi:hypothetical protein
MERLSLIGIKAQAVIAAILMLWMVLLCIRPGRSSARSSDFYRQSDREVSTGYDKADYEKPSPFAMRKKAAVKHAAPRLAAPVTDGSAQPQPAAIE